MSQSATLYKISPVTFENLKNSDNRGKCDIVSMSKGYYTFQGSFMALEYILSKNMDTTATELINEIFTPKQSLGAQPFEDLTPEEQFELFECGNLMPYLSPTTISKIVELLDTITEANIHLSYNAKELNENGIYPGIWHDDNSKKLAYNEREITKDFAELKTIFNQAGKDGDYILSFVG